MKKRRDFFKDALRSALLLGMADTLGRTPVSAETENNDIEYRVVGTFLDGCACNVPCPCEFSGSFKEGCNQIGVLVLTSGTYKGVDLAGAKIVEAGLAGSWTHIYVDASDAQREAATALAKAAFSVYGKVEAVKNASIDLAGKDGRYKLTVDGGKVVEMTIEPVLGVDQRTPIILTNVPSAFGSTVMQARTIQGRFQDGNRSFKLENSNATFNDRVKSQGKFST
jgi:hypothetical protein